MLLHYSSAKTVMFCCGSPSVSLLNDTAPQGGFLHNILKTDDLRWNSAVSFRRVIQLYVTAGIRTQNQLYTLCKFKQPCSPFGALSQQLWSDIGFITCKPDFLSEHQITDFDIIPLPSRPGFQKGASCEGSCKYCKLKMGNLQAGSNRQFVLVWHENIMQQV